MNRFTLLLDVVVNVTIFILWIIIMNVSVVYTSLTYFTEYELYLIGIAWTNLGCAILASTTFLGFLYEHLIWLEKFNLVPKKYILIQSASGILA